MSDIDAEARKQLAQRYTEILKEIEPVFTALEREQTERLLLLGSGNWMLRGDKKRRECIDRINAVRDIRNLMRRIIQQGTPTARPKGIA